MRKKNFSILMISVSLFTLLAACTETWAQRAERPISSQPPETTGVVPVPSRSQAPQIKIWTDKGNQNPTYYVGERIYISFMVDKDCYATIYNIDSTGNVNILFPNPYHRDNLVRRGRIYTLPSSNYKYDLVVQGPTGEEILCGVVSTYVFYHWQYGVSSPPIWSDAWGSSLTWGHPSGIMGDQTIASRQLQKRLQMQPPLADVIVEDINHQIEAAKQTLVNYPIEKFRFYVTVSPY